jgi:hypothetical protein
MGLGKSNLQISAGATSPAIARRRRKGGGAAGGSSGGGGQPIKPIRHRKAIKGRALAAFLKLHDRPSWFKMRKLKAKAKAMTPKQNVPAPVLPKPPMPSKVGKLKKPKPDN